MNLAYKIFTIPIQAADDNVEKLNHFIQHNQIINIQKELLTQGNQTFWCFLIEYSKSEKVNTVNTTQPQKGKKDYKEILSEEDFPVFCELRKWRNNYADSKGIKSFEILTNDQLAEVVEKRLTTVEALSSMRGFGEARGKKFGKLICDKVNELNKNNQVAQKNVENAN